MKVIFNTTQSDLASYNGTEVQIIRKLTKKEADISEVGKMYKIKLHDGKEIDAFKYELCVVVATFKEAYDIYSLNLYKSADTIDKYMLSSRVSKDKEMLVDLFNTNLRDLVRSCAIEHILDCIIDIVENNQQDTPIECKDSKFNNITTIKW